ncbi:HD-GYP domain-containing protein [Bradyrhizobium erythrophlei]|jgi:putative nucleotidyltransferase with HDIG domain|uniref:HDIG domain-containing protein n=1 Tax=Bradyrhizobium erythrophlei TaxID=1437360 RepID=A0A1M7TYU3_9BRAD|nr:HD domain-containing phosphohydrolase [Bradyrhizobium erythrophlei]SHN75833.1 HDIG domain-containing protein [Bradyrhizobium erythrophlei]
MSAQATSTKRRLLLASDHPDQSRELERILQSVSEVQTLSTSELPDTPADQISGVVVDINLRSAESVQRVRNKLRHDSYRTMPRLFVLADALHHGSMQAWALGATDTISRPFDAAGILRRIRAAFPDSDGFDATNRGKTLNRGIAAAHEVMVKIFNKLPAGEPLKFSDVVEAENKIIKAIKHSSLREWLTTVGCHHADSYRHCLFVTGFAVAFAQHLGMRDDDQRRLVRAALLHDVGKAFIPTAILDKPGLLNEEEKNEMRKHPRLGYDALAAQGGYPPEMLDVVLHHHELLDGSGYPDGLSDNEISDIVRLTTIVDIYAALVESRPYRIPFTHAKAFSIMEKMEGKLDQHLLVAFRPVTFGAY